MDTAAAIPASAQFWVILIPVIVTGLVSLIAAIKTGQVKNLVNGVLAAERAENALLRSMLTAKQIEIESAEKVRAVLAAAPVPAVILVPPLTVPLAEPAGAATEPELPVVPKEPAPRIVKP